MSRSVLACLRFQVLLAGLILVSCSSPNTITVSSKSFTENVFLGELIAQQIERRTDYQVTRRLNLGGTFLCHQALLAGEIDIYPEYTGTALTSILEQPVSSDRAAVFEQVRQSYADRFNLRWTPPFGFNNTFAVLVRAEDDPNVKTLTDLAAVAPKLTLGFNFEFLEREDGWTGFREAYGFEFKGEPRTLDLNLVYQALRANQGRCRHRQLHPRFDRQAQSAHARRRPRLLPALRRIARRAPGNTRPLPRATGRPR